MAEKNKGGRPSKYGGVDLEQVSKLAKAGWTDQEMADFFEVDISTWHRWKGKHSSFRESLRDWKKEADQRVERSLYESALGYVSYEIVEELTAGNGLTRLRERGETFTPEDWDDAKSFFDNTCAYCGDSNSKLTKDHFVPLSKGGKLEFGNVLPCCQRCNSSKKDRIFADWYPNCSGYSEERLKKIEEYLADCRQLLEEENTFDPSLVVTKKITRKNPPNPNSIRYWLNNRMPDVYKDRQTVDANVNGDLSITSALEMGRARAAKRDKPED